MKTDPQITFLSEVETTAEPVQARRPFAVTEENRRRFVRLAITSPMWLRRLKDIFGNFDPSDENEMEGAILNISAGGILIDLDQPLNEGDIVSMRFLLQEVERLDNVLGLVKRSDQDGDGCLVGIEFVTREALRDRLTEAELDLLGDEVGDFKQHVEQVLSRYLYTTKGTTKK